MKVTCPLCGYETGNEAPMGQVLKCSKCGEFYAVGESAEQAIADKGVVEDKMRRIHAKNSQTEEANSKPTVLNDSNLSSTKHTWAANTDETSEQRDRQRRERKWVSAISWTIILIWFINWMRMILSGYLLSALDFTNPSLIGILAFICTITLIARSMKK